MQEVKKLPEVKTAVEIVNNTLVITFLINVHDLNILANLIVFVRTSN